MYTIEPRQCSVSRVQWRPTCRLLYNLPQDKLLAYRFNAHYSLERGREAGLEPLDSSLLDFDLATQPVVSR